MRTLLLIMMAIFATPALAQNAVPPAPYADRQLDDPALEAKARELMHELRCLKCQSQSIADSNAPMAGDMRSQVREKIAEGWSPERVRNWLIERYGNWVSYDPPVDATTWPLWIAPILILIVAGALAWGRFRKSKRKGQG